MTRTRCFLVVTIAVLGSLGWLSPTIRASSDDLKLRADEAYTAQKWQDALNLYKQILANKEIPTYDRVWYEGAIARCLERTGQAEAALLWLSSMEDRYSSATQIDMQTSVSVRSLALSRVYSEKASILERGKQCEETVDALDAAKRYRVALCNEKPYLSPAQKQAELVAVEAGFDLRIAECLMRLGRLPKAAESYRSSQAEFFALSRLEPNRAAQAEFTAKVYINKKLGDSLSDRSYYQKALMSYPRGTPQEVRRLAGPYMVTREELEALCSQKQGPTER